MNEKHMRLVLLMGFFTLFIFVTLLSKPVVAKDEILIGTHNPLSGIGSFLGSEQKWAYAQAVQDINRAGGIYVKEYDQKLKVRLITIDDESDPGKAAAATERLIKRNKVDLMLSGQVGAMGTLPGMITAEKFKT